MTDCTCPDELPDDPFYKGLVEAMGSPLSGWIARDCPVHADKVDIVARSGDFFVEPISDGRAFLCGPMGRWAEMTPARARGIAAMLNDPDCWRVFWLARLAR